MGVRGFYFWILGAYFTGMPWHFCGPLPYACLSSSCHGHPTAESSDHRPSPVPKSKSSMGAWSLPKCGGVAPKKGCRKPTPIVVPRALSVEQGGGLFNLTSPI
jgi:hypothetical protein